MSVDIAWYSRHLVQSTSTWSGALLVDTAENKISCSDYPPNSPKFHQLATIRFFSQQIAGPCAFRMRSLLHLWKEPREKHRKKFVEPRVSESWLRYPQNNGTHFPESAKHRPKRWRLQALTNYNLVLRLFSILGD